MATFQRRKQQKLNEKLLLSKPVPFTENELKTFKAIGEVVAHEQNIIVISIQKVDHKKLKNAVGHETLIKRVFKNETCYIHLINIRNDVGQSQVLNCLYNHGPHRQHDFFGKEAFIVVDESDVNNFLSAQEILKQDIGEEKNFQIKNEGKGFKLQIDLPFFIKDNRELFEYFESFGNLICYSFAPSDNQKAKLKRNKLILIYESEEDAEGLVNECNGVDVFQCSWKLKIMRHYLTVEEKNIFLKMAISMITPIPNGWTKPMILNTLNKAGFSNMIGDIKIGNVDGMSYAIATVLSREYCNQLKDVAIDKILLFSFYKKKTIDKTLDYCIGTLEGIKKTPQTLGHTGVVKFQSHTKLNKYISPIPSSWKEFNVKNELKNNYGSFDGKVDVCNLGFVKYVKVITTSESLNSSFVGNKMYFSYYKKGNEEKVLKYALGQISKKLGISHKIVIFNADNQTTTSLQSTFSRFGDILDVGKTPNGKIGFITFYEYSSAVSAIQSTPVNGMKVAASNK